MVGLPFTQARERPSADTSRRTTARPSSTSRPSSSIRCRVGRVDRLEGALDHRLGRARPDAAAVGPLAQQQGERVHQHGLPAPVSPVSTLRPGPSCRVTSAMVARSRTRSSVIIRLGDLGLVSRRRSPQWSFWRIRVKKPSPPRRIETDPVIGAGTRPPFRPARAWCRSARRTRPAGRRPIPPSARSRSIGRPERRAAGPPGCGPQIGVTTMASTPGTTIGPPALRQ